MTVTVIQPVPKEKIPVSSLRIGQYGVDASGYVWLRVYGKVIRLSKEISSWDVLTNAPDTLVDVLPPGTVITITL